jgi:hypothetical protein
VTATTRALTGSLGIALLGLLLAACGSGSTTGTALTGGFTANSTGTYAALRPDGEMAIIFVELRNTSDQPLSLAIQGFAIPAGGTARVLELVYAVRAGSYRQEGVNVTYRQNSKTLHQRLPSIMAGTVSATARPLRVSHDLRHCLTDARGLTDGTA